MTLSSIIFVFGFFPIFLLLYYISKTEYKDFILLVSSLYFYYITDAHRTIYVVILCIGIYFLTWAMEKKKHRRVRQIYAAIGIIATVAVWLYYRYSNYVIYAAKTILGSKDTLQSISARVPLLGISFLCFSIISYISDCYTGKIQYQKSLVKFMTYILMFPKIIMGPIERYSNIEKNLNRPDISMENAGIGIKRFIYGFCKKVIIADNLAVLVGSIQTGIDYSSTPIMVLWLGAISYSLELFFDFAGYSDMAIGIAQMLGFHFAENFNYPYCASSITDFWRRWHISLSLWFRDYVYIPLGGSKKSFIRNALNLLIVWLLTGLWHGRTVNFILWGMVYFAAILFERYILKLKKRGLVIRGLWRVFTLLIINFNWVLFSHTSWKMGLRYCKGMVGGYSNPVIDTSFFYSLREYGVYLVLALLFSTPIAPWLSRKIQERDKFGVMTIIAPVGLAFALIWAISFIMLGAHNPFLYQQF